VQGARHTVFVIDRGVATRASNLGEALRLGSLRPGGVVCAGRGKDQHHDHQHHHHILLTIITTIIIDIITKIIIINSMTSLGEALRLGPLRPGGVVCGSSDEG
jgi:hypothetical protein